MTSLRPTMIRYTRCFLLLLALSGVAACSDDDKTAEAVDAGVLPDKVTVQVGRMGATLQTKGMTLRIPEGALDEPVMITAKNVGRTVPAEARATPVSDVFEFEPAGITFNKDVQITFEIDKVQPRAVVYFTKQGDRNSYEPLESNVNEKLVQASVGHFSLGFVGIPADELDAGGEPLDAGSADAATSEDASAVEDASASADASGEPDASAPAMTRITVNSRDRYGVLVNQTWAAFQDGDGAWQPLAPGAEVGVYAFDVTSARYAVAFVCSDATAVNSSGQLVYELTSTGTLDVTTSATPCTVGVAPPSFSLQGTFFMGMSTYWRMGHARSSGATGYSGAPLSYNTGDFGTYVTSDLLFSVGSSHFDAAARFLFERDILLTTNVTNHNLDSETAGFARLGVATAQALNASANTTVEVRYTTRGSEDGLVLSASDVTGTTARAITFSTVPEARRAAGDRYLLLATDATTTQWRRATWSTYATDNLSLSLPLPLALSFSGLTTPYFRPVYSFPHEADAGRYMFSFVYSPVRTSVHDFSIDVNPAALLGTSAHQLPFPDFSQVAGFNTAWVGPTGSVLSVKGSLKQSRSDALGTLSTERGQSSTLQ